ncbi:hypothetical protein BDW75DRAFT_234976 [Aspergillus navahoensis]
MTIAMLVGKSESVGKGRPAKLTNMHPPENNCRIALYLLWPTYTQDPLLQGHGAILTAVALINRKYGVRVFDRQAECKVIGGAVLLSTPVLVILRSYGKNLKHAGPYTTTYFPNRWGKERAKLPFNEWVKRRKGRQYGVLRSAGFQKMLDLVLQGVEDGVAVRFKNGTTETTDILVAADGFRSAVLRQAFGIRTSFTPGSAFCGQSETTVSPPMTGSSKPVSNFFLMLHDGKPGFEWWIDPEVPKVDAASIMKDWAYPMPRFVDATNFDTQVYRWEIYNQLLMKKRSRGRIMGIGDAYLGKALDGVDLRDLKPVSAGFVLFGQQWANYVSHCTGFARFSSRMFHQFLWPLATVRDMVFDYTPLLGMILNENYPRMKKRRR